MRLPRNQASLIILAVALVGCVPYEDYLYSLPTVDRVHNGEAVAVVSEVYGIDYRIPVIRWVEQEDYIKTDSGGPALGITHDCVSWVLWRPSLQGDPTRSTVFGETVLSHEMAHCALWLYRGDGDRDHSDVEWWGTKDQGGLGGLVRVAMNTLDQRGL